MLRMKVASWLANRRAHMATSFSFYAYASAFVDINEGVWVNDPSRAGCGGL